jgi:hypothetical protein
MRAGGKVARLVRSLIRITVGVTGGLAILVVGIGLLIRQPNLGRYPFPEGSQADGAALRRHVEHLCTQATPRSPQTPSGLDRAADYIRAAFSLTRSRISEQRYAVGRGSSRNIIARFGPPAGPLVVIGAHYDVFGGHPGADDNASGIAGLLELARLLDSRALTNPVELVAFSTEEPPHFGGPEMGSAVHVRSLQGTGTVVRAMICLEMIGYFTPRQPYSNLALYLSYPWKGDFVALVGRWQDRGLVRHGKRSFRGATDVPVVSFTGPVGLGSDLSDHRNYWAAGYSAVMVTDTAFWRNPNYHTAGDVPATLDYERMAGVVDGVLATVIHLSDGTIP